MASKDVKKLFPHNAGLYVITDINLAQPRTYFEIVTSALMGGARIIQVRDKTTPFEDLVKICIKLRSLCDEFGAILIINDNPYLAKASNAHGVHIGQEDIHPVITREILGPDKIIGLSTHNKTQAMQACYSSVVDYIGLGPIYQTSTKPTNREILGPEICAWAKKEVTLPFVVIGGINLDNVKEVIKFGANNIAVISAIMASKDIAKAVSEFISTMSYIKEVYKE